MSSGKPRGVCEEEAPKEEEDETDTVTVIASKILSHRSNWEKYYNTIRGLENIFRILTYLRFLIGAYLREMFFSSFAQLVNILSLN